MKLELSESLLLANFVNLVPTFDCFPGDYQGVEVLLSYSWAVRVH